MTKIIGYFAVGFGSRGCIPNGATYYAVTTRKEVCDAVRDAFPYSDTSHTEARKALADLGIRNLWAHAKRFGFSSIFRELDFNGTNEILNFMGMTEQEYNDAIAAEDY